jgi:hypothetical protein
MNPRYLRIIREVVNNYRAVGIKVLNSLYCSEGVRVLKVY